MSDPYEGVSRPDPERERLFQSVLRPASLEVVAEAVSAATDIHTKVYVERHGDLYQWSFAYWEGGPFPLLRATAAYLKLDHSALRGVCCREADGGWCVQTVSTDTEPDESVVLFFEFPATPDEVRTRILSQQI